MDEEKPKVENETPDESEKINVTVVDDDESEHAEDGDSIKVKTSEDDNSDSETESNAETEAKEHESSDNAEDDTQSNTPNDTYEGDPKSAEDSVHEPQPQTSEESGNDTTVVDTESEDAMNELLPPPDDDKTHSDTDTDVHASSVDQSGHNTPEIKEERYSTENEGLAPVAVPPEDTVNSTANADMQSNTVDDVRPAPEIDHASVAAMSALEADSQVPQHAHHPHRNNKKFAIVMVLVIGLMLAGIAVYVYMSTSNNTAELNSSLPTQSASNSAANESKDASKTAPATEQDVDATTKKVDETLQSLDDTSDLNEDQISDQALGL